MRRRYSFTLIEMMLVVLVLAVLAGAVVSNLSGVYAGISLESAANDIEGAVVRASQVARRDRATAVLSFQMNDRSYFLKSESENSSSVRIEWEGFLPSGVSFVRLNMKTSSRYGQVRFHPDGRSNEGELILRGRRGTQRRILFTSVPGVAPQ